MAATWADRPSDRLAIAAIRRVPGAARARRRAERLISAAHLPRSQRYATWMAPFSEAGLEVLLNPAAAGAILAQRRRPVETLLDRLGL